MFNVFANMLNINLYFCLEFKIRKMKNLFYSFCLLIGLSSWATSVDYDILSLNINDYDKNRTKSPDCDLDTLFKINQDELADESFEFDTMKYLPTNFNAYTGLFEEYELIQEVEDQAFDFETAAYLPVGFDANATYLSNIKEIATIETDEPFDFNMTDYLPVGFNVYPLLEEIVEMGIIQEDEQFDFNTEDYLPNNFDAHATEEYAKNISDVSHITSKSL